jgi:hypothetical protein
MTTLARMAAGRLILMTALALPIAAPARAQQPATSFDDLRRLVQPDDTIYVTDTNGVTVKGRVAQLSAVSLDLRGDAGPRLRFSERDVNNVVAERSDSLWNGALIGFTTGALSGLLIELAGRTQYEKFSGLGAAGLGATGLATGFLIDVLNKEKSIVYLHASAPQARSFRIVPLVSRSTAGVRLFVGF